MPTISLTALKVRTAAPGEYRDMGVPGLWLIVSPAKNHARRWSVVGRDKDGIQRRAKLGAYPEVTLADARIAASLKIEEIKKSRGGPKPKPLPGTALVPAAEQKPETIAAALAKFIDRHKGDYGKISSKNQQGLFNNHVLPRWGDRPLKGEGRVTRYELKTLLDNIAAGIIVKQQARGPWPKLRGGPGAARQVFDMLSAFFKWCLRMELAEVDPTAQLEKSDIPPKGRRNRVLLKDNEAADPFEEIKRIWKAACDIGYLGGAVYMLALATGQRRTEVAELPRGELNLGRKDKRGRPSPVWILPAERQRKSNKPGEPLRDLVVPLSPLAVAILTALPTFPGPYLFTSNDGTKPTNNMGEIKKKFDRCLAEDGGPPMPHFVLHDLRRTVRTGLSKLGVRPDIAARVVGHVPDGTTQVERTYDRWEYFDEKRKAVERWSNHLYSLLPHPVVPDFMVEAPFQKRSRLQRLEKRSRYCAKPDLQAEAARLYQYGWTTREIGERHGESSSNVHRAIKRELGTDRRRTRADSRRGSILPQPLTEKPLQERSQ